MTILNCKLCSHPIDITFDVDDRIGDTCLDCIAEMESIELLKLRDTVTDIQAEYIDELLNEREIRYERALNAAEALLEAIHLPLHELAPRVHDLGEAVSKARGEA